MASSYRISSPVTWIVFPKRRSYIKGCMIRHVWYVGSGKKDGRKDDRKDVVIIDLPVGLDIRDEDDDGCFCCSALFFLWGFCWWMLLLLHDLLLLDVFAVVCFPPRGSSWIDVLTQSSRRVKQIFLNFHVWKMLRVCADLTAKHWKSSPEEIDVSTRRPAKTHERLCCMRSSHSVQPWKDWLCCCYCDTDVVVKEH